MRPRERVQHTYLLVDAHLQGCSKAEDHNSAAADHRLMTHQQIAVNAVFREALLRIAASCRVGWRRQRPARSVAVPSRLERLRHRFQLGLQLLQRLRGFAGHSLRHPAGCLSNIAAHRQLGIAEAREVQNILESPATQRVR